MGWDRTISWKESEQLPSFEELRFVLEDFLGDLGIVETLNQPNTLYATFISNYRDRNQCEGSFPFKRITSIEEKFRIAQQRHLSSRERWFEVTLSDDYISITTRQQDEFTNVVATGFATLVARFWHGKLDRGG